MWCLAICWLPPRSDAAMALRDVIPPPDHDKLCQLQLMRHTLVKFVEQRNFEELITGCYVRVLLEMRQDTPVTNNDHYYIAAIKGAQKGPAYTGFSWDGLSTEWHVVIELPPCFRSGPNNNVVQFNSISNSPFDAQDYTAWVRMTREAQRGFPTVAQIELRASLLHEAQQECGIDANHGAKMRRRPAGENPAAERERWELLKSEEHKAMKKKYVFFPLVEDLANFKAEKLNELQHEALELAGKLRSTINTRNMCVVCLKKPNTVVTVPCKHQAMCTECCTKQTKCPVKDCGTRIDDHFEPFAA